MSLGGGGAGHVRTADHTTPRLGLEFFHRDRQTQFIQPADDLWISIVAALDETRREIAEDGTVGIDSIAQKMHRGGLGDIAANLDARKEVDPRGTGRLSSLVYSCDRVVISESESAQTNLRGQPNHFRRTEGPIGSSRMTMEIDVTRRHVCSDFREGASGDERRLPLRAGLAFK